MTHILAVDDEPLMLEYLEHFLQKMFGSQVKVLLAQNGKDALELIGAASVDLVITDIRMPVMDGLELCRRLSERKLGLRVIILSGYEDFSYAHQAMKYGVSDYLLKPVIKEELALAVQKLLGQIKTLRQEQQNYLQVLAQSQAYRMLVGQNLIGAVTHQESLKLQHYYKLAYQLGIDEIQTDGAILLLDIDSDREACLSVPLREQSVFRMILSQYVSELFTNGRFRGFCLPEADDKTLIYLAGDDHLEVQKQARGLYQQAAGYLRGETGASVSGALGGVYRDVLQMDASYQQAKNLLARRLLAKESRLELYQKGAACDFYDQLHELTGDLYASGSKGREVDCRLCLAGLVQALPNREPDTLRRFGLFLLQELFAALPRPEPALLEQAVQLLNRQLLAHAAVFSPEETQELFWALAQLFFHPFAEQPGGSALVSAGKNYIYRHYSEPISLALLAEELGVSESYFSTLFHKETGESYIKFLTRVRMEKAAELLRGEHGIKIYEVARQVGYFNAKHFNHTFKLWQGVPPNEYQQRFSI